VNTAIPAAFIQQLLERGSPVMKLRLSSDQAVSKNVQLFKNYKIPLFKEEFFIAGIFVHLCRSYHQ